MIMDDRGLVPVGHVLDMCGVTSLTYLFVVPATNQEEEFWISWRELFWLYKLTRNGFYVLTKKKISQFEKRNNRKWAQK